MLEIEKMIMGAMKNKEKVRTQVYKNIKAKILEFKTAKNAKPYDDVAEIAILKKMHSELVEDKKIFESNGRTDLAESASAEIEVLESLLPKAASSEEIQTVIDAWISANGQIEKKSMGMVIKEVKSKLPNADGKTVSELVKNMIAE